MKEDRRKQLKQRQRHKIKKQQDTLISTGVWEALSLSPYSVFADTVLTWPQFDGHTDRHTSQRRLVLWGIWTEEGEEEICL